MKITGNDITKHLMRWAASNTQEIVVPNYYIGRWECDVLKISKSGHLYEYEVKVSRADFKNDFNKVFQSYLTQTPTTKHNHIRNGNRVNRFYYVVPEGLITPEEVPAGFGLIYAKPYKNGADRLYINFQIVKVSKLFKKESCKQETYIHVARNLSLKLANAKARMK